MEELEAMDSEWSLLQRHAADVDAWLCGKRGDGADNRFRTLVHGDFKSMRRIDFVCVHVCVCCVCSVRMYLSVCV